MNRRDAQAGMTLIEVLVVLAVIGVAAGGTMMAIGDRGRSAETEAVRLARHMTLGVDEVLLSGVPLVLDWDAEGYRFGQMPVGQPQLAPDAWPAAPLPVLGTRHDLPGSLALSLRDATLAVPVLLPASAAAPSVTFDITGTTPAWSVTFDGFTARAQPEGAP